LDGATWPVISQHPHSGELLLHAGRRMGLLERLYIGGDIERPDRRQRQAAVLAPREEPVARPRIGAPGIRVADVGGATAQMVVTGAAPSTLTGNYSIVGDAGGAVLQYGSGGITQIGDGASNGSDLYIDGTNAFVEVGATNSNNALSGLATIASNGLVDLRDGTSVTTTSGLTVNGGSARLKVDAYGGQGGSTVTIGGNLVTTRAAF
jgi:hypothetical protein